MRPIRVEFQAFGPYAGCEKVDFEALSSNGLFLICGKTGKGKTMILDAMTYALYGRSSGSGRDSFEAMRCTNADFNTATYVKFEFENNGDRYLFERRLERKVKNLSPSYNMMKKDEDGSWQVMSENAKERELNAKAVEIIGLEYDQFCQVIILPQGKFEKLLTSGSSEKEAILTSIFGEDKWQEIAKIFYEEAEERSAKLKGIKERIGSSLAEEECESVSDLETLIEDRKKELDVLEENYQRADYDRVMEETDKALALVRRFEDLSKAEERIREYEELKDQRDQWEKALEQAKRADNIRKLFDDLESEKKMLSERRQTEAGAKEEAENVKKQSELAAAALEDHVKGRKDIEDKRALKIKYEGTRNVYENLDKAEADLTGKKKILEKAKTEAASAAKAYETLTENLVMLREEFAAIDGEHGAFLKDYVAGITGELARDLKAGEECPVCGSKDHPHKAPLSENSVTKEMVEQKESERTAKLSELNEMITLQEKAGRDLDEKKKEVSSAERDVTVAESELSGLKRNLVSGIDSLAKLNEAIGELAGSISEYESRGKKLEDQNRSYAEAISAAATKAEVAASEVVSAEKRFVKAEAALKSGLAENGFSSSGRAQDLMLDAADMDELGKKISEYDAGLKAAKESLADIENELKDKAKPDEEQLLGARKEAIDAKAAYAGRKEILTGTVQRLTKKAENLKKEGEDIEERISEAENDLVFAKKLRGDTGIGLQRYVLSIMFSSVIAAANKMLEKVHGGRYRLFRSDDKAKGSNKKGLELKVSDKLSVEGSDGRFVNTLSGGEKFLVSLALSIGMSTIAQRSGIKIEALFIDEGFGTLDEDSINDAMNVLGSISDSNGLVGIISHVRILQDQIPSKLIVESDGKGSHIIQTLG